MIPLRLPAIATVCSHACFAHSPVTVGSALSDTFVRARGAARQAAAPISAAMTPPLFGGVSRPQAIGLVMGTLLFTVALYSPLVWVQFVGVIGNLAMILCAAGPLLGL